MPLNIESRKGQASPRVDDENKKTMKQVRSIAEDSGQHIIRTFTNNPDRNDETWMKHTLTNLDSEWNVTFDFRPVHTYTLTEEVEYIKPKARVY